MSYTETHFGKFKVLAKGEENIRQYIKEAISIDNLVETFNDNSHLTLLKLLALQDIYQYIHQVLLV